jgi:hypothetical protein
MLTIFACPKPFKDPHISMIQRNAIVSWTLLEPRPEIILFGDEEGTEEICRELRLRYIPEIARNEFGTPLVNDIFEKAQQLATYDLLCYVNADIILMSDFIASIEKAVRTMQGQRFLIFGRRCNVDIAEALEFKAHWEEHIRAYVTQSRQSDHAGGVDYFVFPQGLWGEIPPLAIGRFWWDHWMLYRARVLRARLINATPVVIVVHQNHSYSKSIGIGKGEFWGSIEAQRNSKLAGGFRHVYTLSDATHMLCEEGLKKVSFINRVAACGFRLRFGLRICAIHPRSINLYPYSYPLILFDNAATKCLKMVRFIGKLIKFALS